MTNDYDEFEATMQAAGWTLDEIEAAWQADQRGERPQGCSKGCAGRMCLDALHCDAAKATS